MTPEAFIAKWQNSKIKERAAAQEHFLDLCRMLGEQTPAEADRDGIDYGFEFGATKTTGGRGFADVFKRGFFGMEYKGTHADLTAAFAQLQRYAVALNNPPLLIVSDVGTTIRIHTNWTNSVSRIYDIPIAELGDPEKRGWLKAAFTDPDALRPKQTRQELTEEVAGEFARLARSLRDRGHEPEPVAHFINRLVFCMFAEDVKLLPNHIFTQMLERALETPEEFVDFAGQLFAAMRSKGGRVGFERIAWFNGGLFDDDTVFVLTRDEIRIVYKAAQHYWGDIDPAILGTLFERGLDPDKRSQLGAHYTDRDKIMMIIDPVIVEPLSAEWEVVRTEIEGFIAKANQARGGAGTRAFNQARAALDGFLQRLSQYRVLDPACGSGNFLYLALRALKDLEHRAQVEAEALGLPRTFPRIGPEAVLGIELNPYAAELARVSVWIGDIQWNLKNGFAAAENPILKPLRNIECRDALVSWVPDTSFAGGKWVSAEWPIANAIIGNPPFLGSRKMAPAMGSQYVSALRKIYTRTVPKGADFVCFWFAKAHSALRGSTERMGLVSTNSLSNAASRQVLRDLFTDQYPIAVWRDEPWTVSGAAVRVAIVCMSSEPVANPMLDDMAVDEIHSDLRSAGTTRGADLTLSKPLRENANKAYQGVVPRGSINPTDASRLGLPNGDFAVSAAQAREMLVAPLNPNGRPNTDVVVPYLIARDLAQRPSGRFIVAFGTMTEREAAMYELPFNHIAPVKLHRQHMAQPEALTTWWQHWRPRPEMSAALAPLTRFIVTPRVSKHRLFLWRTHPILPDNAVVVVAREDDVTFGVLHSRFHELWALRMGSTLEDRPRYTPTTTFQTFPFPHGLTPDIPSVVSMADDAAKHIAHCAKELNQLRENWLNPADLVRREPEVVPGYPERILPINEEAESFLKKRTLTNLYNERPAWLHHAHEALNEAVAAAYGWPADLGDDEVLARLFALNQERGSEGHADAL
ncbi:class I SAM-dependent DNA methyltransferase [Devosia marina]|uniref:site-specific DNA-methyltransferase (adenine-specific) n=1 Tax=Devosia marina TaxID=2683198 RepID=A0A7X3FNJ1_9HYPH|nr:DNA methyltransferase [Devosia marina]MVS97723.1 class I SAM-dependent DNA methyltransferase [Devosia marina]